VLRGKENLGGIETDMMESLDLKFKTHTSDYGSSDWVSMLDQPPLTVKEIRDAYDKHKNHKHPCCAAKDDLKDPTPLKFPPATSGKRVWEFGEKYLDEDLMDKPKRTYRRKN
jgi:hypothetical protein